MQRIGLALSGGGFRATIYHLGIVRFLRDAGILPKITHLTTVSGGSILGAHLALNWDKYCGSDGDFDDAAAEILNFVQLDVRNRIVRRFPFCSAANFARRITRQGSARQLTRAGLLEQHYEKFLYGDVPLCRLPERPRLHILTTNLSEGCLCSFNRDGLLLQMRTRGSSHRFERVHLGLATVPMAVAASSAFPGFFPPLELNGWDVGAEVGDFDRQAFTDGGVYDNLGLRMFRHLEQTTERNASPLKKSDFLALEAVVAAMSTASNLSSDTPFGRIRHLLATHDPEHLNLAQPQLTGASVDSLVDGLWEIIRTERLFRDPAFENVSLTDPTAQSMLHATRTSKRNPDVEDQIWLNRHIVESALGQVIGKRCLRLSRNGFDGIMVSDAGGKFKVTREVRAGGLVRTALRSTDILMDRVWQLELEAFENTPNVLFFPISEVVKPVQDPTAPHPEIQRQARRIRTDLDRFTPIEITALAQHGYCVARKICRSQDDYFSTRLDASFSDAPPWDPMKCSETTTSNLDLNDQDAALATARKLQSSAVRRIWSTVFSWRDWTTYVWVPLLICLAVSLPYALYKMNRRAAQQKTVLSAIAETSPVYRKLLDLLEAGPEEVIDAMPFEEVDTLEPLDASDLEGFEIISDTRIFDCRGWTAAETTVLPTTYSRVRVRRLTTNVDNFMYRMQRESSLGEMRIACKTTSLHPKLYRAPNGAGRYLWQLDFDMRRVPLGGDVETFISAALASDVARQVADEGRFSFTVPVKTGLLQVWMLMPENRQFDTFSVRNYPIGSPEVAKIVVPHSEVRLPFGSIATFRIVNPDADHRYDCSWTWKTPTE